MAQRRSARVSTSASAPASSSNSFQSSMPPPPRDPDFWQTHNVVDHGQETEEDESSSSSSDDDHYSLYDDSRYSLSGSDSFGSSHSLREDAQLAEDPLAPSVPVTDDVTALDNGLNLNGELKITITDEDNKSWFARPRAKVLEITEHVEALEHRKDFILTLARALLTYGAPSHRIEAHISTAARVLSVNAGFVYLPAVIMVSFGEDGTKTTEMRFVKAGTRLALSMLSSVHQIYRRVIHDKIGAREGKEAIESLFKRPPLYPIWFRCLLAFLCSSIMCSLSFGGSVIDMFIGGAFSATVQYLNLKVASHSMIYADVHEISAAILVSFFARVLSTLPEPLFCYNAIASAGVTFILPGFAVLMASLELTSRNVSCGSGRLVHAVFYTFLLGYGLTIGSDIYLFLNKAALKRMEELARPTADTQNLIGKFTFLNGTSAGQVLEMAYQISTSGSRDTEHMIKGCFRNPEWPLWRQPLPMWTILFMIPLYSFLLSLANQQNFRSPKVWIMVPFSIIAYSASKIPGVWMTDRVYISAGIGALTIGFCGSVYSRLFRGTAFTSMVTGILLLVPSALSLNGGLIQSTPVTGAKYLGSFSLGLRMVQVAIGITLGLFISQTFVYAIGRRKGTAHFSF